MLYKSRSLGFVSTIKDAMFKLVRRRHLPKRISIGLVLVIILVALTIYVNLSFFWSEEVFIEWTPPDPFMSRRVIRKAQACLLDSPFIPEEKPPMLLDPDYELPPDAEQHYRDLLRATRPLRGIRPSTYAGYSGPWLEDMFIKQFCCNKPLSFFGGLIPLFVQWTDLWHLRPGEEWQISPHGSKFFAMLRKDVMYLAISQHAEGLYHLRKFMKPQDHWNILTLSGGGHGHAPIPLFLNEQPFHPVYDDDNTPNLFVFAGNIVVYPVRLAMMRVLGKLSSSEPSFAFKHYTGEDWAQVMRTGKLNLAPRGYGRTSFRLIESVQMGLVPVYVYDDHDWSPYKGSEANIRNFGFAVNISEFESFVQDMAKKNAENPNFLNLKERVAKLKKVRESHYTLSGLMQQIQYFFQDDERTSITCQRHPMTYVCCDHQLWVQNT